MRSCLPDFTVELAIVPGERLYHMMNMAPETTHLFDGPVDSYVQEPHMALTSDSPAVKALATTGQSDTARFLSSTAQLIRAWSRSRVWPARRPASTNHPDSEATNSHAGAGIYRLACTASAAAARAALSSTKFSPPRGRAASSCSSGASASWNSNNTWII